ncbi:MAG: hypothetical protein U0270_33110 [Labilithrix sp.]|mgnify:FL=1
MNTRIVSYLAALGILSSSILYMACSDDSAVTEPPGNTSGGTSGQSSGQSSGQTTSGDAGPPKYDAGVDDAGNPKDCFDPPFVADSAYSVHFKIINSCSNADRLVRTPKSTKIFADGGVPTP